MKMCEASLSKEELSQLRRAFALFDVDGDGAITIDVMCLVFALKISF